MATLAPAYAPRRPTETALYGIVRDDLETFLRWARETYAKPLPRFVEHEFRAYLRCSVFAHGFVHRRCDDCGHDILVAGGGWDNAQSSLLTTSFSTVRDDAFDDDSGFGCAR